MQNLLFIYYYTEIAHILYTYLLHDESNFFVEKIHFEILFKVKSKLSSQLVHKRDIWLYL